MSKALIRNEHREAYAEGRIEEIPQNVLDAINLEIAQLKMEASEKRQNVTLKVELEEKNIFAPYEDED